MRNVSERPAQPVTAVYAVGSCRDAYGLLRAVERISGMPGVRAGAFYRRAGSLTVRVSEEQASGERN